MTEIILLSIVGFLFYILFGYLFVLFMFAGEDKDDVPPRWIAMDLFLWPVLFCVFGLYGIYSIFHALIFNQWPDERKELLRAKLQQKVQPKK